MNKGTQGGNTPHKLDVSAIYELPFGNGKAYLNQGGVLAAWCSRRGLRSVVVVTNADHSRRLRRVFRRAMKNHPTKVSVRIARFSQFDADRWWQTRSGLRIGIVELEKLMLDVARHPVS